MRGEINYRQEALFITGVLSIISLFVSRAGLSIAMGLFFLLAFFHGDIRSHLKAFFNSALLVSISLLFFIPLVSGIWSDDMGEWTDNLKLKLPLLLFPLAFAGNWKFSLRQWKIMAGLFLLLVLFASLWSAVFYFKDASRINELYLKAKSIVTPLGDDHVRFSWMVAAANILVAALWPYTEKKYKFILAFLFIWFAVYLHLLAARTGLVTFYMLLAGIMVRSVVINKNYRQAMIIAAVLIALPLAAYFTVPTFRNKISYFYYDLSFIRNKQYLPGGNDGNRYLSLRAGTEIIQQHPLGVGSGDITKETNEWYRENIPGMLETDRLYPSSEWLVYGMTAGWPGIILFTSIMLVPFFIKPVFERIYWMVLNASLAFSFLFDVGLEVQYGIFLYALFILWWWKWSIQINRQN